MTKKLHNPKSHAPAVYIPCWLIQVPTNLLSTNAKILYGRLAQWSNEKGIVYRSINQLSEELGTPQGTLEKHLRELKEAGLIGTYHPKAGGINYYEFYDHEWMYAEINKNLVYADEPTSKNGGTPPPNLEHINKKEVKEEKRCLSQSEKRLSSLLEKTKPYVDIWNQEADKYGGKKMGVNQRQLKAVSANLDIIKKQWEIELTPETFKAWLSNAIMAEYYNLIKFKHRMDVCLRWHHFEEAYEETKQRMAV